MLNIGEDGVNITFYINKVDTLDMLRGTSHDIYVCLGSSFQDLHDDQKANAN